MEPVGVVFVGTFIFVIFLQAIGMMFHRALTLKQIIATTKFSDQGFDEKKLLNTMKELNQNQNKSEGGEDQVEGRDDVDMKETIMNVIEHWKPEENDKRSGHDRDMKTLQNEVHGLRSRKKPNRDKKQVNMDQNDTIAVF